MKRVVRRKYSSVSFDGTTPSPESASRSEQELLMKKVERQASSDGGQRVSSASKMVVVDKSIDDSVGVIREFLKVPKDAEFGYAEVVTEFLRMITEHINLLKENAELKARMRKMLETRDMSLQDHSPSWN